MKSEIILKAINAGDLNLPKKELKALGVELATTLADEGFVNLIKSYAQARQLNEFLGSYLDGLKDHVLEALEHEDKGKSQQGLVLVETSTSPSRIDYMQDVIYADLHNMLKKREEQLKAAKKSSDIMVDGLTGEEIPSLGLKVVGKTIVKATLK